jgi:hypothetical protein
MDNLFTTSIIIIIIIIEFIALFAPLDFDSNIIWLPLWKIRGHPSNKNFVESFTPIVCEIPTHLLLFFAGELMKDIHTFFTHLPN